MKSMLDTQPDDLLLECMSRADQSAFEALFVRHYSRVYGVLYSLLGSREASEDLTQETFLELYRHPPTLSAEATLPAWLCRVAVNKGYNSLRGEKRSRQRIESFYTQEDPYAEFQRAEDRTRVREVLVRLQERQSKLLLLRQAGLSLAEIAGVIGVAPGSVGTMLARAETAFVEAYRLLHPSEEETQPKRGKYD